MRAGDQLYISGATINMHLHLPIGAQKKDEPHVGSPWYAVRVWGWFYLELDAKTAVGSLMQVCDRIPIDRPSYDCQDWRSAQTIPLFHLRPL